MIGAPSCMIMSDSCVGLTLSDELNCLVLRGPVPLQEVSEVLAKARQAAAAAAAVAVDLSEVEHLHAGCVQVLLALRLELETHGRTFRLRGCSDAARRALRLGGLAQWLTEGDA